MDIRFDASHFEKLGTIIHEEGWPAFFKQGPTLEPLYPLLISCSMKKAAFLGVSYQKVQTVFQIVLFFLSLVLLYRLLSKLDIHPKIIAAVLLYFGFSPALINSSLSLFSEVITYPFILGCLLTIPLVWNAILEGKLKETLKFGLLFTLLATTVTFSKAILEYVFVLFLLPFVFLLFTSLLRKQFSKVKCASLFLLLFFCIFQGALNTYKSLNQKYNGYYTFTDARGPFMFYHYAVKRTAPLDHDHFMVTVLSIPGEHVCRAKYGELCQDWWYDNYSFAEKKANELKADGMPERKVYSELMKLGFKQILSNPFQYALLTSFETLKLFFWESTKVGFVYYPTWLETIYDIPIFKNILRLAVMLITVGSFLFVVLFLLRRRENDHKTTQLLFIVYFVLLFMLLYSSVITITRYAFPIASFYLVMIAFMLNEMKKSRISSRGSDRQ
jgi:hypothetical protein